MSFNNAEDNSFGKDIKIVFTLLTGVDVLVVEAVSSFLISPRDNKVKEHKCLFANGGKFGHSVTWIDAKILKKIEKMNLKRIENLIKTFSKNFFKFTFW